MAKNSFVAPNGQNYKSRTAYIRSLRGRFAGLPYQKKKNFKRQVIYQDTKVPDSKIKITGQKQDIKEVSIAKVKVTEVYPEKNKHGNYELKVKTSSARTNKISKEDADGNITEITESEESSRYTPSEVDKQTIENIDENTVIINAESNNRVVKSTVVSTIPSITESGRLSSLENRFMKYYQTPVKDRKNLAPDVELSVREKITLAKHVDSNIPTGAPTHKKLTPPLKNYYKKRGVIFV